MRRRIARATLSISLRPRSHCCPFTFTANWLVTVRASRPRFDLQTISIAAFARNVPYGHGASSFLLLFLRQSLPYNHLPFSRFSLSVVSTLKCFINGHLMYTSLLHSGFSSFPSHRPRNMNDLSQFYTRAVAQATRLVSRLQHQRQSDMLIAFDALRSELALYVKIGPSDLRFGSTGQRYTM